MGKISEATMACGKKICEHEGPVFVLHSDKDMDASEHPVWTLSASQSAVFIHFPGIGGNFAMRQVYSSREAALAAVRDRLAEAATGIHKRLNSGSHRHTQNIVVTDHRDDATGDYVVRIKTAEGVWSIAAANGPAEAELIVEALRGVIRAYRGFDPCEEAFDRLWHYVNGNPIEGGAA
ncbi:MAG: hypothetical protein ACK5MB_02845 [Phycisphaerales bacterium]